MHLRVRRFVRYLFLHHDCLARLLSSVLAQFMILRGINNARIIVVSSISLDPRELHTIFEASFSPHGSEKNRKTVSVVVESRVNPMDGRIVEL